MILIPLRKVNWNDEYHDSTVIFNHSEIGFVPVFEYNP